MLDGKSILITGGTGSFGQKFCEIVLKRYQPRKLIVFSRNEYKQYEMGLKLPDDNKNRKSPMRYLIGDVRDQNRLLHAFKDVDIVVHAAALKHVPICEYNPMEAVKTNVIGAMNVVTAAIETGVKKVIALSTDKAASPINLYGASKLCSDKIFTAARSYAGALDVKFAVARYGNVFGSNGSVVPFFLEKRKTGILPITDERMTRFWITLQQGVNFVLQSLELMEGNEVFVPKIPSTKIVDLAKAIAPECTLEFTGIRPGEKLHELMIGRDDARITKEYDKHYVIEWNQASRDDGGVPCPINFQYSSETNDQFLSTEQIKEYVRNYIDEHPEFS